MRKEVKNYYEINFGPFSSCTAAEIETRINNELWFADMPQQFFLLRSRVALQKLFPGNIYMPA